MRVGDATLAGAGESCRAWLDRAAADLESAHVEAPRRTAEVLLADLLAVDRVRLISHPEMVLDPEIAARFRSAVARRAGGEPLQYITGRQEFYGLEFTVSPAVLIPRPETELVVERALEIGAARARAAGAEVRFADVGTGSGCIAVALACLGGPAWRGWALDLSLDALALARRNAARHDAGPRLRFAASDLLDAIHEDARLDLVVSNPPYVARAEAARLVRVVHDYEPHLALYGGASGLDVFERLVPQAARRLAPGGALIVEVGIGQAPAVAAMAEGARLTVEEIHADLQGIPRVVTARKPG